VDKEVTHKGADLLVIEEGGEEHVGNCGSMELGKLLKDELGV